MRSHFLLGRSAEKSKSTDEGMRFVGICCVSNIPPRYDPVLVLPHTAVTLKVDLSDYQSELFLRVFSGAVALANMTPKENNAHSRRLFRARNVTTGDLVEVNCPNLMAH
jgi:hypothetical protein